MIRIKAGVRTLGMLPQVSLAIQTAAFVWLKHGAPELVVTSVIEGRHRRASIHYTGAAVDLRTHNLPPTSKHEAVGELRERLADDFDALLENEGEPEEHVHVEYQPKRPY
jgi:hypothetical protein